MTESRTNSVLDYSPDWVPTSLEVRVKEMKRVFPGVNFDTLERVVDQLSVQDPRADGGFAVFPTMEALKRCAEAGKQSSRHPLDTGTSYVLDAVKERLQIHDDLRGKSMWPGRGVAKLSPSTARLLSNDSYRFGDVHAIPFNAGRLYSGLSPFDSRAHAAQAGHPPMHMAALLCLLLTDRTRWAPGHLASWCAGTVMPVKHPDTTPRTVYIVDSGYHEDRCLALCFAFDSYRDETYRWASAPAFIP
ncbi:hypothetical protein KBB85_05495 [Patescibacteria group bacterium]|nr:hypothetical protein [Patescibacteria group bacterium]